MIFYVVIDIETDEYLTEDRLWLPVSFAYLDPADPQPIVLSSGDRSTPMLYLSEEQALEGLQDVLGAWSTRFDVPSVDEFEIRKVRPSTGWAFVD